MRASAKDNIFTSVEKMSEEAKKIFEGISKHSDLAFNQAKMAVDKISVFDQHQILDGLYQDVISDDIINFVWFSFAIGYFILFVVLFIQCTKSILMIKMSSDVKRNGYIISEINKEFLKKTMKERISKNAIDLLR